MTPEMPTTALLLQKGMGICNPISHFVILLGDLDVLRALKYHWTPLYRDGWAQLAYFSPYFMLIFLL